MIGLRQKRLGVGPKQVLDHDGNIVCECQVPRMYGDIRVDESDIDKVRKDGQTGLTAARAWANYHPTRSRAMSGTSGLSGVGLPARTTLRRMCWPDSRYPRYLST